MLNFTPPPFSLSIGGVDFAPLVTEFRLQRPRADIGTPYSWTGSITLAEPLEPDLLPESLDDLTNPVNRWAKGLYPVQLGFEGTPLLTVRIQEYVYDEDTGIAELQVGDWLTLLDYRTPPKDYKGLGFSADRPVTLKALVEKALQESGIPDFAIDLPETLTIDVAPNKFNGSYIKFAQQFLGERGYWLYTDPAEVVRVARYPRTYGDVRFLRSREGVENFKRQRGLEVPAEKIVVSGTAERRVNCKADLEQTKKRVDFAVTGTGILLQAPQRTEQVSILADRPDEYAKVTTVKEPASVVLGRDDDTPIVSSQDTERKFYDDQGKLKTLLIFSEQPLGKCLPDQFPKSTVRVLGERIREDYSDSGKNDGVLRFKKQTKWAQFPIGSGGHTLAVKELTIERWTQEGPDPVEGEPSCQRFTYQKIVYRRDAEQIDADESGYSSGSSGNFKLGKLKVVDSSNSPEGVTPPSFPTREATSPTQQVAIKSERSFHRVNVSPFYEEEYPVQASTLQTNAEAGDLAELVGQLQHQRYLSRQINAPLPAEWLTDSTPFAVHHCHTGAFVMDGENLNLAEDGLELAWVGNFIGTIPEVDPLNPVLSQPASPVRQILRLSNDYGFETEIEASDVYANSQPQAIANDYDYRIVVPVIITSDYDYSVSVREQQAIQNAYDYSVSVSPVPVLNAYDYSVSVVEEVKIPVSSAYDYAIVVREQVPPPSALYDARQISGLADNELLPQWHDTSGNGHHATLASGAPLYRTALINGLPAVRFNGSSLLAVPHSTELDQTNGLTVFVVCTIRDSGTNKGLLGKFDGSTGDGWFMIPEGFSSNAYRFGTNGNFTDTSFVDNGVPRILAAYIDQASPKAVANIVNGVLQQVISPAVVSPAAIASLTIGSYSDASVAANADVGIIRLYNSRLSNGQINLVGRDLADEWNLTWTGI